jgi:hypothetical protein
MKHDKNVALKFFLSECTTAARVTARHRQLICVKLANGVR